MLRESGCIKLPSQRTLRDYTYYVRCATGFSADLDQQLKTAAKIDECTEDWKRCACIVMDEMYIKEDLVYDKHTGALIGFANLGEINEHLLSFQHIIEGESDSDESEEQELAKTMFVIMVRGLITNFQFPYVQFPCGSVTGDLLFDPFWEAVYRLERMGFKVLAATADGASTNRRFIKIKNS